MATITITPPEGWTSAKAVQQVIIPHLAAHGATMTLDLDDKHRVRAAKVVLPRTPPEDSDTDHAKATQAQIEKIRRILFHHYGWKETE